MSFKKIIGWAVLSFLAGLLVKGIMIAGFTFVQTISLILTSIGLAALLIIGMKLALSD